MRRRPCLLCPGPVNVTPAVRRAVAGPDLCHREPEFAAVLTGVRRKLLRAFSITATHRAAIISGSGTAALEAAVLASVRPGRKLLVVDNGVYGARIAQIAAIHHLPTVHLRFPGLAPLVLGRVEAAFRREAAIETVAVVHHETSTGVLNPVAAVARLARQFNKSVLVDAISSLGAEPAPLAAIDLCVGSAGKCLHGYPGLSFVLVARRFLPALSARPPRSLYLDLRAALAAQEAGEPPFTPAVPLIQAFDAALDALVREGVAARIHRYRRRAAFLRRGFDRLGLAPLAPRALQSHALTALRLPPGVRYDALHDAMKRAGYIIYAGQSGFRGTMFRIAHMGALTPSDLRGLLRALARALPRRRAA
ncbi:MAG: aminotransferase class V-fold PLP-dependent enzyme [Candidatus Omnitrophica bacterium]|nr:aminotransferase class V-fold PLP-dependent enzyme [Candidatus Omnitrophota bacterium]